MKTLELSESVHFPREKTLAKEPREPLETKRTRLDADLLTSGEIEALMQACSARAATGIRNRAIIALGWRSGLRIGELLALRLKDLDFDSGTVTVQNGKGGKHRIVGLDAGTAALIKDWVQIRKSHPVPAAAPVFCTLSGGKIDQSYIRHLLPRLARRAGISKRVHSHGLRHACAMQLERDGASLTVIRDTLGHSSAAVTDVYLRRLGAGEAVAFTRERTWPSSGSRRALARDE